MSTRRLECQKVDVKISTNAPAPVLGMMVHVDVDIDIDVNVEVSVDIDIHTRSPGLKVGDEHANWLSSFPKLVMSTWRVMEG